MKKLILTALAAIAVAPMATAQDSQPTSAPASAPTSAPAAMYPDSPQIGEAVPDFALPNLLDENDASVSLSDVAAENKATVIIWHSVTCPFVVPLDPILPGMASEWAEKGVAFLAINSNKTENNEQISEHLSAAGFNFPVLRDEGNVIADAYNATRTPEVFVVDPDMNLRYHGRISDNTRNPDDATTTDLADALNALLAGEEPAVPETIARGCSVKR